MLTDGSRLSGGRWREWFAAPGKRGVPEPALLSAGGGRGGSAAPGNEGFGSEVGFGHAANDPGAVPVSGASPGSAAGFSLSDPYLVVGSSYDSAVTEIRPAERCHAPKTPLQRVSIRENEGT